jgi:transposase
MKRTTVRSGRQITIGLDLGDRRYTFCVLNGQGEVIRQGSMANSRGQIEAMTRSYPGAMVVMEAGMQSPWVSRFLSSHGLKVIVANPRKVRAIYESERKSDARDAEMLARLGRMDVKLLHPVEHGSEQAQQDMLQIKLRDALVRSRVALINSIRFTLKSLGHTISNPSSQRFHKTVMAEVPQECRLVIAPVVRALEELSQRIKELDASLAKLAAERYPQTIYLQQVSGVGPITALYFVLKIGDPNRFERTRDVGAFVGLCPRRDQSGESDKELRISKCGDAYLRRLLVSAAQYILGPFGADSALRLQGLQMAAEGTAKAKKRAVVAVARQLAVLLLTLWKRQEPYEAFPAMG